MMQIRVEHFSATPAPTDLVLEFLAHDKECDLYLGGYHLCLVQWVEPSTPTLLLDEQDDALGPPSLAGGIPSLPFGPFDPTDLLFTKAIENLENLNCVTSYPGSTFVIVAGSNLWAYTPFDGTESQFTTRIRAAFSSLVPQERAVIIRFTRIFVGRRELVDLFCVTVTKKALTTVPPSFMRSLSQLAPLTLQLSQAPLFDPHASYTMVCPLNRVWFPSMEMYLSFRTTKSELEGCMMYAKRDVPFFLELHLGSGVSLRPTLMDGLRQMRFGTSHPSSTGPLRTFSFLSLSFGTLGSMSLYLVMVSSLAFRTTPSPFCHC